MIKRKKIQEKPEIKKGFVWYAWNTIFWILVLIFLYELIIIFYGGLSVENYYETITSAFFTFFQLILFICLILLSFIYIDIYGKDWRQVWFQFLVLIYSSWWVGSFLFGLAKVVSG